MILIVVGCKIKSSTDLHLPPESSIWTFSVIRQSYDKVLITALKDSIINLTEGEIIDRQFGHLCAQDTIIAKKYVLMFGDLYKKGLKPKTPLEFYPNLKYANDSFYHTEENFYQHTN